VHNRAGTADQRYGSERGEAGSPGQPAPEESPQKSLPTHAGNDSAFLDCARQSSGQIYYTVQFKLEISWSPGQPASEECSQESLPTHAGSATAFLDCARQSSG
jgi:hypothetical protein